MENRASSPASQNYFAGPNVGQDEVGKYLMEKVTRWENFVRRAGLFALWRKAFRFVHNMDDEGFTGYEVGRKGEQGELAVAKFNHLRSLRTSYISMATATLGDMEPQAENDDYESEVQCRRARGLLQYYDDVGGFELLRQQAIEYAVDMGTGGYFQRWCASAGGLAVPPLDGVGLPPVQHIGTPTGSFASVQDVAEGHPGTPTAPGQSPLQPSPTPGESSGIHNGDLKAFAVHAVNIIFDPRSKKPDTDWNIIRNYENKFDVASEFAGNDADLFARVVSQSRKPTGHDTFYNLDMAMQLFFAPWDEETDEIPVFYFLHRPTPACPAGRFCIYLASNLVLLDIPYKDCGARFQKIQPSSMEDTGFGYTPVFDLLAPQETIDAMSSIRVTNQKTFGVQGILAPKNSDLNAEQISAGCVLFEYTPGLPKPEALQLTSTPKEIIECRESDILEMGQLIGVSSVVRGDPEASLKSGSALALVQAQSVQFSSNFQRVIGKFTGSSGQDTLEILQAKLDPAREYLILGADNALEVMSVGKDDLQKVKRVVVKAGNPLTATTSGRVTMAEMLINMPGIIKDPGQLLRLLETGRIEPVTRSEERERANIRKENEQLMKGIGAPPPPMPQPPPPGSPPQAGMQFQQQAQQVQAMTRPDGVYTAALITDDHRLHVREHLTVLKSPVARRNPQVVQAVMGHVNQHKQLLIQATLTDLPMLELTGQAPLQSVLPPPPPGPQAGPPPPANQPKAGQAAGIQHHPPQGERPGPQNGGTPPDSGQQPKMPQYPRNDLSGQRYEPPPSPANQ